MWLGEVIHVYYFLKAILLERRPNCCRFDKLYNVEILDKGENIDCIKWNTRLFIATKYRNVLMKNKFVKIEADYVVDQCMYTLTNHQQDLLY